MAHLCLGGHDSADIVVASKFQSRSLAYAPGLKGKRKRSKRGPLTTAYSTAQGIVPGLLGIGDGVIRGVTGNPALPERE